ncbi:MAG: prepilin-type N-terminal cleavage/methylation domain-containing protein [Halioglobus sp.]|nr:prepilin-type N-terminal cleavage/methylation domain-containing protein [Halioglobus sp.]
MRSNRTQHAPASAGFSLLELIVAIAILALALGALYQAAGGATRNVRIDEKYAYSVELARSLLTNNGSVPPSGVNVTGTTADGFDWYVATRPLVAGRAPDFVPLLHGIEVGVNWSDDGKRREVVLHSVVEGYSP